jgi:hypothetical protein
MNPSATAAERKRLERLAWFLDNSIPIPGLDIRVGFDALIGLIPGFGDSVGALLSSYILAEAARLGAPRAVLLKMAFNIAVDALIGAVPVLGDLFDFAWKANQRNVDLLRAYYDQPRKTVVVSRLFVWGLGLLLAGMVLCIGLLSFLLVRALWNAAGGI